MSLQVKEAILSCKQKAGKRNCLLGVLIFLWLGAVVLLVMPDTYNPFGPEKEMALVLGTSIPLLFGVFMIKKQIDPGARLPGPWILILFLMVFWPWLILPQVPTSTQRHLLDSFLFTGLVASAGLATLLVMCNKIKFLLRIWIVLGWIQGALVLLQFLGLDPFYLWTGTHGTWRVYGTMGNPNLVAAFLVPIFFLTQWPDLISNKKWRLLALIGLVLAIIATGSRAGALFLALGLIVQFASKVFKMPEGERVKKALYLLFPLCIVAGSFSVGFYMGKGLDSIEGRLIFWKASWELIKSRPWSGYGLGSFRGMYPEGVARLALEEGAPLALPVHAHNDWIEFAVELGIIPGLIFLSIAIWAICKAWSQGYRYIALSLGVLVLQAGWDSPLHTAPTALLFFMLLGSIPAPATAYRKYGKKISTVMVLLIILISLTAFSGSGLFYQQLKANWTGAIARQVVLEEGWQESGPLWEKAWKLAPSQGVFAYWYSQTLALEGDYSGALDLIKEAEKTYSDFHLYILKARLEYNQGNEEEAIAILKWLKTGFPDYEPTYYYLEQFKKK